MASVDSGVETRNDSNDSSATEPQTLCSPASKSKEIVLFRDASRFTLEEIPIPEFRCPVLPDFGPLPVTLETEYWGLSDAFKYNDLGMDVMHRNAGRTTLNIRRLSMMRKAERVLNMRSIAFEKRLHTAVMTNNIERVQQLLSINVNPNCSDSHERTPLHLAACRGYADIVQLLLDHRADPNQRDRVGNTPLHLAVCTNNAVVVKLLLKAGTDVKSIDFHGRSPLQIAQSMLKHLPRRFVSDTSIKIYHEVFEIIDMLREFLNRTGQDVEAELINAFATRLTMSKTRDQVENQVQELLASLSHLSIDEQKCAPNNDSAAGSNNNTLNNMVVKENGIGLIPETPQASGVTNLCE